ncbi:MAG: N-acetyl-gamma-glutamyl-phosphate reductase, partial [Gemmatimonadales bacterium]
MKVAVIGGAGYVGAELLRLLLRHPNVTECVATSRSQAGKPIASVHPGLAELTEARFAGTSPGEVARGKDVVFLALEHGESSRVADAVFEAGPGLLIDLAADFRLRDLRLYERFYGAHPSPEFVGRFTYALADIEGEALRGRTALSIPGCFATAAQLALYPLARAGANIDPVIWAITGSSGAGRGPRDTTHHPSRAGNVFAYSVDGHRHNAEILSSWRAWVDDPDARATLLTHSGPFVRGIYLTLHARLPDGSDPAAWFRTAYGHRRFIRLTEAPPQLTHAVGSNMALVHAVSSGAGEALVMVAIDNLIKGAGGQAVQAMN